MTVGIHSMPPFIAITLGSCPSALMECSRLFGGRKGQENTILSLKELEINETEDNNATKQSKRHFKGGMRRAGLAKGTHTLSHHRCVGR